MALGGRGPAVGAGPGLEAKPDSAEGPGRGGASLGEEHRSVVADFSADRARGFALGPGVRSVLVFCSLRKRGWVVFVWFFFFPSTALK